MLGLDGTAMEYSSLCTHRLLLRDSARVDAFLRAINAAVRPGDVVLDVGAGSGILSLFAARAGARRVYAVECTPIARVARELARLNGFERLIRVIEAPVESVRLEERVDLLVSEWLGSIGVDENLLHPVLVARDRWLEPGGRVLPRQVSAWMAPAWIPQRPEVGFFRDRPFGLDLRPLAEESVHELLSLRRRVASDDLVGPPRPMWNTDVASVSRKAAELPARATIVLPASRRAPVNALVAWFSAQLADGVELTNAPGASDTHWNQLILPLERERVASSGDLITVRLVCIPAGHERSHFAWSVRVGTGRWEHHDTRCTGRAEWNRTAALHPRTPAQGVPHGGSAENLARTIGGRP